MMMDCPRCGFNQPKDRYCANCGLDVEHYVAKPKPFFSRLLQNASFHLTLIGLLILVVIGYIFYSQREVVRREVGHLISGLPLSSRESADAGAPPPRPSLPEPKPAATATEPDLNEADEEPAPETAPAALAPVAPTTEKAAAATEIQKFEISSWEVPREGLSNLITGAEKVGESNGGRAYLWSQGAKMVETVQNSGRRLSLSRTMPSQAGAVTSIEAPMPPNEPFQFGIYLQVVKLEGRDVSVKWASSLVMPNANAMTEVVMNGNASLPSAAAALLLVIEPPTRTVREELISKAGDGPWSVLTSPDFRAGTSEWVMLVQAH